MRKTIITLLALGLCLSMSAQSARALFEEEPYRAANNMHSYEFHDVVDTPAPKGYKPFYITHYGRHGSRYEQNSTFSRAALDGLNKANVEGLLTPKGMVLLSQINQITDAHKGMEGALSPRGEKEHQMIAGRMYSRFRKVFTNKARTKVNVLLSTSPRSIVSGTNFTVSLKGQAPQLDFSYVSADKYMYFMGPSFNYAKIGQMSAAPDPNAKPVVYDFSRLYSIIFKDPVKAKELIPNMDGFVRSIFSTGGLCEVVDYLGIDIFRDYFTAEELEYLYASGSDSIYLLWGNSKELGDDVREIIKPLLKDILDKAEESLKPGSDRAADLRFGHDTGILPLFSLLGIDSETGERYSFREAHSNGWLAGLRITMATNFQMIFYRNSKGDILAKILYNEKEVTLPGLQADFGPYYKWSRLQPYLLSLTR